MKDVSFPEINLVSGDVSSSSLCGLPPSRRSVLVFFAGRLHGHIRSLLLIQWKQNSDGGDQKDAVLVYDQLPNGVSYSSMLKKSRFFYHYLLHSNRFLEENKKIVNLVVRSGERVRSAEHTLNLHELICRVCLCPSGYEVASPWRRSTPIVCRC